MLLLRTRSRNINDQAMSRIEIILAYRFAAYNRTQVILNRFLILPFPVRRAKRTMNDYDLTAFFVVPRCSECIARYTLMALHTHVHMTTADCIHWRKRKIQKSNARRKNGRNNATYVNIATALINLQLIVSIRFCRLDILRATCAPNRIVEALIHTHIVTLLRS